MGNNNQTNTLFANQPQNLRADAYAKSQIITIELKMSPFSNESPNLSNQEEMIEEKQSFVHFQDIEGVSEFHPNKTQGVEGIQQK